MSNLYFTSTRLQCQGRQGILKPDENGYYRMPIGALNCANSLGEFYTDQKLDQLMSKNGELLRKLESGKLFGEWGHPVQREGESPRDFMNRSCGINDKETCVFFKHIELDRNITPEMKKYGIPDNAVVFMADLKPMGPLWETLDRSLKDPHVNTTFSGRYLTSDYVQRGVTYVVVEGCVTWDAVTEQGHAVAEKTFAPRLESHRTRITPQMVDNMKRQLDSGALRMEQANNIQNVVAIADRFFRSSAARSAIRSWV